MVVGVVAKPGPELGTGLLAKGTGRAPAATAASVAVVATTDTGAVPGAVVVSAGVTGGGAVMAGGRGVVCVALSGCRNVGGSAMKCWGATWSGAWTEAWAGTSEIC